MEGVLEKKGLQPGKTVAIFGGTHGNERVGVAVIKLLKETLVPDAGVVYLVEGNPAAIAAGVRQLDKNLNRCFLVGNNGSTPEDIRARELMQLLDRCDALLDLHASNSKKSIPFIVGEEEAFDLARTLDFSILSYGWDAIEPGAADGYMHQRSKPALCLECGYAEDFEAHVALALRSAQQFLKYFGILAEGPEPAKRVQKIIEVYRAVTKKSDQLTFAQEYADFEVLEPGKEFASDEGESYVAKEGDCIVFPHKEGVIGSEAFILGRYLS